MDEFYQQYPTLLTPTATATAPSTDNPLLEPEHAAQMEEIDQLSPVGQRQLIYDQWLTALTYASSTRQADLSRHPASSVSTYVSGEELPLGIQLNSTLGENRTLLQLGALFENSHRIDQPYVGEPDEDKGPDASGEPGEDKDLDVGSEPNGDREPDASGEPDKDEEPDASGGPDKDKESDASGKPDKDRETKTGEGSVEGRGQNQNPDKAGRTTSKPSLDNSLNSSASQETKSTESTHTFSNKNMIGRQKQLPERVLPRVDTEVPGAFWIVLGGALLVTSETIYIKGTRK